MEAVCEGGIEVDQAIAASLVVGVSTVKKHLTHIYAKLGVSVARRPSSKPESQA